MVVLDASVILKWLKPDERSEAAESFLEAHLAGREVIFVPVLLLYEVGNALRFSRVLTPDEIEQSLALLHAAHLTYVNPNLALLADTVRIATETGLSVYDGSYVALSRMLSCSLITADKKLYDRAKIIFPAIQLL